MKDRRIIRVKTSELTEFRNNLRKMWLSIILNQSQKIRTEQEALVNNSGGPLFKSKDHLKQYMNFAYSIIEIKRIGYYSICLCPICLSNEEDMIWDAYSETWYCENCYTQIYRTSK